MSPDPSSASPTATPEKKALLEAFDTVLKSQADLREAERAEAERRRSPTRTIGLVCLLVALVVAAYLYIERPEWVFPTPPPPESLALREASLRIGIANAAQHVDRFRRRTGRLPATLEEAGAHADGLVLQATASGYRLSGQEGDLSITLDSEESLGTFIGNSFQVIARRSR